RKAATRAEETLARLSAQEAAGKKLTKAQVAALARAEKRLQAEGSLPDDEHLAELARQHQAQERALDAVLGPRRQAYAVKIALEGRPFRRADLERLQEAGWILRPAGTAPATVGRALAAINPSDPLGRILGPKGEARAVVIQSPGPFGEDLVRALQADGYDISPAPKAMREAPPSQSRAMNPTASPAFARKVYAALVKASDRSGGAEVPDLAARTKATPEEVREALRSLAGKGLAHISGGSLFGQVWRAGIPEAGLFEVNRTEMVTMGDTRRRSPAEAEGSMAKTSSKTSKGRAKAPEHAKRGTSARRGARPSKATRLSRSNPSKGIRFLQHSVTDGTHKARVHYSLDNRTDGRKAVTIYAKDYDNALGDIFGKAYKNDTDIQTDYFEKGRVVLFADHPLYREARAAVERFQAKRKTNPTVQTSGALERIFEAWTGAKPDKVIRLTLPEARHLKVPSHLVLLGRVSWLADAKGSERRFEHQGPLMVTDEQAERIWLVSEKPQRFDLEPSLIGYRMRKPKFGDRGEVEYVHAFRRAHAVMDGQVGALTGTFRITPAGLED
ncbi:MAG TPA: hypothetical protein VFT46_06260, partial [Holophagaceae bacterium]|nr:hypothetical protein [Holophagaceae bacterium]